MEVEIETIKREYICCICGGVSADRVMFSNFNKKGFIYMNENESSHIECYIALCSQILEK